MRRRIGTAVGAAVAALATTFGAVTPAAAATSPLAPQCTSGGVTRASIVVLGVAAKEFLVEARYSQACGTTWTTVTDINQPDCLYGVNAWHEGVNNSTGAGTRTPSVHSGSACSASTITMSKAGKSTRACAHSTWEGRDRCTAWI